MTELLPFLKEIENLKSVTRTAWTASGRRESTAEHTWRLSLFVALAAESRPEIDALKAIKIALVHDLGERYAGDISAATRPDPETKHSAELAGMKRLCALLPEKEARAVMDLWQEYDAAESREARLVKALDKAETIMQHNQGANPPDFTYDFNLEYGASFFKGDPALEDLRRELDRDTRLHIG